MRIAAISDLEWRLDELKFFVGVRVSPQESAVKRFKDEIDPNLVQVYGTKLAATVHYIRKLLLPKKEGEEPSKILVFSQFNNFLHKFGYLLGV